MPTIANNEGRQGQNVSPSTVYAQPWWQGFGINSCSSGESMRDPVAHGTIQSQGNGGDVTKETGTDVAPQSGLNGGSNQEVQRLKHVATSPAPIMGQHLGTNSQMELVGHSIMLTYPCPDPKYGGILAFGANPQFYGGNQNRMPLPLPMEEEPVFVNAKQYHGILRRREIRAKAELENKVTKVRKRYLHESRHQHAMRRARGSGGRFLNTKKLEGNATASSEGRTKSGAATSTQSGNSSSSEHMSTSYDGNSGHHVDRSSVNQDMHEVQTSSNGNSNGHGLASSYYVHVSGSEQGIDHFDQENWSLLVRQAPQGLARSK